VTGHHLLAKAAQHEDSRYWVYRLDPDLAFLYGGESYTLIDWDKRLNLKGKDLARWLQLYLATHAKPFPVRLLLDSRVVDVLRLSNLILVIFSSLKPLFFSGLKKAWHFSGNVGA
jgi:hypothetical protein